MNMEEEQSLLEESVPWEVRLLKDFCNSREDVDSLGYAKKSVLAGSWFLCRQAAVASDVCLCGSGKTEESLVRQWVEYYLVRIKRETSWDSLTSDQLLAVFKELNDYLAGRIFVIGYKLCLADILLYYGLHRYLESMSFGQRSKFIHVSRWFDQVQHFPGVRPFSFPLLVFHKNPDLL